MAVNSQWLPGTPEAAPADQAGEEEEEQEIEQRPASPTVVAPAPEKRSAKAPAPPSGPLPFFGDRSLNGEVQHVRPILKQSSKGTGGLLRETSSQPLAPAQPPQEHWNSEGSFTRRIVEDSPQSMAQLINDEVKEELHRINRKLDDITRQLKGKRYVRNNTDPLEHSVTGSTQLSGNLVATGKEGGGKEGGPQPTHPRRESSCSSRRSSLAEVRVDAPTIKTLYRQRSMKLGPMSNGLEMVLSTTPPPLKQNHSQGELPSTPSRLQTLMSWGKSKTMAFDPAAESKYDGKLSKRLDRAGSAESSAQSNGDQQQTDFARMTSIRTIDAEGGRDSKTSDEVGPNPSNRRHDLGDDDVARAAALLAGRRGFSVRRSIWNFIENPESSTMARWFEKVNACFIIFTAMVTVVQAIEGSPLKGMQAAILETVIDVIFCCEVVLRLVCCPSRWVWLFSVYNWIDVLAAAPFAVRASIGWILPEGEVQSVPHGILICAVPTLRLLKTLRRFEKFHLLIKAFHLAAEALPVLLFILTVIAMVFSALIYLVEPRDNIPSLPRAFWLSIVTMTTVGYGDVTPKTGAGNCIIGVLVVITVLYMAIPLGIIGNAFTDTWQDRDRILLMQRTRDRLCQWGYTAHDIPALFRITDSNADGELDIKEFRKLLNQMQVGLGEERIIKLFKSFDGDGSGTVDDQEFVRALFPEAYHAIYANSDDENSDDDA